MILLYICFTWALPSFDSTEPSKQASKTRNSKHSPSSSSAYSPLAPSSTRKSNIGVSSTQFIFLSPPSPLSASATLLPKPTSAKSSPFFISSPASAHSLVTSRSSPNTPKTKTPFSNGSPV